MPTPVPAPFPAPAPSPYPASSGYTPAPAPAPHRQANAHSHSPAPAPYPWSVPPPVPAPVPVQQDQSTSSSEQEGSAMEENSPSSADYNYQQQQHQQQQRSQYSHEESRHRVSWDNQSSSPTPEKSQQPNNNSNNSNHKKKDKHSESLKAAADLIHTLDSAYAEINTLNASSAREADEARAQARTAAEIARRYTTRSHPTQGATLTYEPSRYSSSSSFASSSNANTTTTTNTNTNTNSHSYKSRAPMMDVETNRPFSPSKQQNRERGTSSSSQEYHSQSQPRHTHSPRRYPRTPPSAADRIAQANAEDALSLSLELERTKQKLEAEQMAHDETKSALAEERSKNHILQQKIHKIEGNMEAQRERLGRSGDALEQELQRAKLRVEAAEEDAELALEIAKENAESRDQLENMLQQALEEIQTLRNATGGSYPAIEAAIQGRGTPKSSLRGSEDDSASKRSVRFSDPISYSQEEDDGDDDEEGPEKNVAETPSKGTKPETPVATPNRRPRSLVSAGRRILAQSLSNSEDEDDRKPKQSYPTENSADRRRRVRRELKLLDSNVEIPTPSPPKSSPSSTQQQRDHVLEVCRATTKLLQESGKRLELDGHWWRQKASTENSDENDLQSLARQYCQSVEVKFSRQKSDLTELESLCSFLEDKSTEYSSF